MNWSSAVDDTLVVLAHARKVANYARDLGLIRVQLPHRPHGHHIGAVIADAVLQAGVNYRTVVLPRVEAILHEYPDARCLDGVERVITSGHLVDFLRWRHPVKLERFTDLIYLLYKQNVQCVPKLREMLFCPGFRNQLRSLHGIGPKTVDYMACLVGIDNIAVDRHIRRFARRSGVEIEDYDTLQVIFSYAADLLALPRRDFDLWVWMKISGSSKSE